jgi:hypothetical protein
MLLLEHIAQDMSRRPREKRKDNTDENSGESPGEGRFPLRPPKITKAGAALKRESHLADAVQPL